VIRRTAESYLLLAPFLVVFAVFVVYPIFSSLFISFTDFRGMRAPDFVGVENYRRLFGDERFFKALANTSVFAIFSVSLTSVIGLTLALVFQRQGVLNQIMRTIFFLPAVTSSIALSVVWRFIFTRQVSGLANTVRGWFGLEPLSFLADASWTIPILILVAVWSKLGYTMILFLAGLRAIPSELYEVAAIDGASPFQRFLNVTLPLLRPTMLYVLITSTIASFQVFQEVYLLFATTQYVGGVLDSALTLVVYLYDRGFTRFQLGYASSIAWVLFVIIFLVTLINLRAGRVKEAV
jgi:multiple sugar transport system permease protein